MKLWTIHGGENLSQQLEFVNNIYLNLLAA